MLDINFIRNNAEKVRQAIKSKHMDEILDLDQLLELDKRKRALTASIDELRQQRNQIASTITNLPEKDRLCASENGKRVSESLKTLNGEMLKIEADFDRLMLLVPGIPDSKVPEGTTDEDNVEIRRWGEAPKFDFPFKNHIDICTTLKLADFEGPSKYAGSRAYALTGDGALLELAVLRFAFDHILSKGFTPISPPLMVKEEAMIGTGYFPIGEENAYRLEKDNLFLVGTSEVGLVSLYRDRLFTENELPLRCVGMSTCFRREAGAAGKDTKGLYRKHQFQKVEQVVLTHADELISENEHNFLLQNSEEIMQQLGLPYRLVLVCSGDLGQGQVLKHDIEAWMPSRNNYGETHSCSSFHEFQSRRSNIRYRGKDGTKHFVHTLNNTAIASPRILITILENYQNADGTVTIPDVLRPYMGGRATIARSEISI
jgi:seryl-tRNA synthetase